MLYRNRWKKQKNRPPSAAGFFGCFGILNSCFWNSNENRLLNDPSMRPQTDIPLWILWEPFRKLSWSDIWENSPGKLSWSSLGKLSWKALLESSPGKLSLKALLESYLGKLSLEALLKGAPGKLFWKELLESSPGRPSSKRRPSVHGRSGNSFEGKTSILHSNSQHTWKKRPFRCRMAKATCTKYVK